MYIPNPQANQSEYGVPQTSQFGQGLLQAQPLSYSLLTDVTRPTYLFRGFMGRVNAIVANFRTVYLPGGFQGQLPLSQNPDLSKPYPWQQNARGL